MVVVVATCVPPTNTLYPVTAVLSVDAIHERSICEVETMVPERAVGVVGICVSVMMGV